MHHLIPCEKCGHPRSTTGIGDGEIASLLRERDRLRISAPSHYTYSMVRHRLKMDAKVSLGRSRICQLAREGQPLEAEMHEGQKMIPAWRVLLFLDARIRQDSTLGIKR